MDACTDHPATHVEDTLTHSLSCEYCGMSGDTEKCSYVFAENVGTCAACGDEIVITTPSNNLVYDGTPQTFGSDVHVTQGDAELSSNDYAVTYADNTNAGTATVTVTLGDDQGTYTRDFRILPRQLTIKAKDQTITYGESIAESISQADVTGLAETDTLAGVTLTASGTDVPGGTIMPSHASITRGTEDATANYEISYQEGTLTIRKADQPAPAAPVAEADKVLDTSVTLNPIEGAEYSRDGGDTWQDSPEFTGLTPNTQYTFTARLKGDGNHNPSPASAGTTVTTRKLTLESAVLTVSGSYTYNGTAQTPAVTVTKDGTTLTAGTDYTIACTDNTSAGTATVTITGAGDYEGTKSASFTIHPKALTVSGITARNRAYNGTNAVEITAVTLDGVVGGDAVAVDTSGLTGTIGGTNAGTYSAVALHGLTLTGAAAGNYTLTQPAGEIRTTVTISKAAPLTPKTGDLAVVNKRAYTYTYGVGSLRPDVPDGMSLGSTAVAYELGAVSLGSYYSGSGARIAGQTLTLPVQEVDTDDAGHVGTVTVIIHTDNFEDMTATINVRSVNKIMPEGAPTLSAAALSYGQPLSTITLSGSLTDGGRAVPGTFAWSSPGNRPAVQEAYDAAWVFTPDDNDTYAIVNGISTIRVLPASIAGASVTLEPTAFRADGEPHSPGITGVTLDGAALTEGTDYTAEIPTGTEAGTYTVTVTGKGNYTGTVTVSFTINPVQTGDDFEDENGTTLRLEVETGLSSVPEALADNPRFDTPAKIETELRAKVEEVMANAGDRILIYDVTLQYRDENGEWHNVEPDNFPAEGVTAVLPYPAGTGMTGYTFTVQHLISSGSHAGEIETLPYELTPDGLRCRFSSLSPVAIGYQSSATPDPDPTPVQPDEPTPDEPEPTQPSRKKRPVASVPDTPDSNPAEDSTGHPAAADDHSQNCPSGAFPDLNVTDWYHEAVDFVLERGLMSGTNSGFAPNAPLSRAMLAQILWNHAGKPAAAARSTFPDVPASEWYAAAVDWASENGIVSGYSDGRFGPNDSVTREQFAVMLWRFAGSPAASGTELRFTDADKVSGYALNAIRWAAENGIISGSGGQLAPQGLATRAQAAQMLKNFLSE